MMPLEKPIFYVAEGDNMLFQQFIALIFLFYKSMQIQLCNEDN